MHRTVLLKTYPTVVELVTTFTDLQKLYGLYGMPDHPLPDAPAGILEIQCDTGEVRYIMYFCDHETALDNVFLVHELIHLKNAIGEHTGVKMGLPAGQDEHEAYFFDYMFELFSSLIRYNADDRDEVHIESDTV